MDKPIDFKAVAAQLAHPEGEAGIQTAAHMNVSNGDMTRHAIDLMDIHPNAHVLEIGPGNGNFAAYVLSKGAGIRYTGVDRSETMINEARNINRQHIEAGSACFEWTDGLTFPFLDQSFDYVLTVNTLYFWENPRVQLTEIRRMLKPGGMCCLAIASRAFMERLPFTAYGFTLYTPAAAQELLAANGFTVVDTTIREHKTIGAGQRELLREEVFLRARAEGRIE
ncbi:class I SAM-dependent methyltransferase [Parapedobacter sp. 2B3]|uniref:class I SAM-dependent methyltransferase n=1 Tax=Parapedobacter sp. 2B3 TaxID=3342381 RepID=UPI0035B5BF4E